MVSHTGIVSELTNFCLFLWVYAKSRLYRAGIRFERIKDIVVAILVVKRGKYSQSFLNTSFFLLVSSALIGGPVIAENNPIIARYFATNTQSQSVLATDVEELPIGTTISQKPRDKTVVYTVKDGDTLASIAEKFDISVDTIKWVNNLRADVIKPGQELKILPVTGIEHRVGRGETIYSIAKRYDTDAQQIADFPFNDFTDLETFTLAAGQTLYVPNGVPPRAKPVARARTIAQITAGEAGASGTFIWPTSGHISQNFVWYHPGIDIANKALPDVLASDGGTVAYSNCGGAYGCHVIIDHDSGYQTLYAHMSQLGVSAGQAVAQGQRIGRVGSTGRSTGPHLHFEVRRGGALNPLSFLK